MLQGSESAFLQPATSTGTICCLLFATVPGTDTTSFSLRVSVSLMDYFIHFLVTVPVPVPVLGSRSTCTRIYEVLVEGRFIVLMATKRFIVLKHIDRCRSTPMVA